MNEPKSGQLAERWFPRFQDAEAAGWFHPKTWIPIEYRGFVLKSVDTGRHSEGQYFGLMARPKGWLYENGFEFRSLICTRTLSESALLRPFVTSEQVSFTDERNIMGRVGTYGARFFSGETEKAVVDFKAAVDDFYSRHPEFATHLETVTTPA